MLPNPFSDGNGFAATLVRAGVKDHNYAVSPLPPKGKRFFREVKQDELYITLKDINLYKI